MVQELVDLPGKTTGYLAAITEFQVTLGLFVSRAYIYLYCTIANHKVGPISTLIR